MAKKDPPFKHLTSKELEFCSAYLANGGNAAKAAAAIGYHGNSGKTRGYRILQKEGVRRYIELNAEAIIPKYSVTGAIDDAQTRHKKGLTVISTADLAKVAQLKMSASYDWKVRKLLRMVEFNFPDDMEKGFVRDTKGAVAAIAELNKMQGHYAAEKLISANLNASADADVKEAKDIFAKILANNENDY